MYIDSILAILLCFLMGFIFSKYFIKSKVVEDRWSDSETSLAGGFIIFFPYLIVLFSYVNKYDLMNYYFYYLLGLTSICLYGLIDDKYNMGPVPKLMAQVIAAIIVYQTLEINSNPLYIFWMVFVMNAVNLSDNIDMLATSLALITAIILSTFLFGTMWFLSCALIIQFLIIFLINFNKYPAKMFMGDCGSMGIGYLLGFHSIILYDRMSFGWGTVLITIGVICLFGMFVMDTLYVILYRTANKKSIMVGDTNHLSHLLLKRTNGTVFNTVKFLVVLHMGYIIIGTVLIIVGGLLNGC